MFMFHWFHWCSLIFTDVHWLFIDFDCLLKDCPWWCLFSIAFHWFPTTFIDFSLIFIFVKCNFSLIVIDFSLICVDLHCLSLLFIDFQRLSSMFPWVSFFDWFSSILSDRHWFLIDFHCFAAMFQCFFAEVFYDCNWSAILGTSWGRRRSMAAKRPLLGLLGCPRGASWTPSKTIKNLRFLSGCRLKLTTVPQIWRIFCLGVTAGGPRPFFDDSSTDFNDFSLAKQGA